MKKNKRYPGYLVRSMARGEVVEGGKGKGKEVGEAGRGVEMRVLADGGRDAEVEAGQHRRGAMEMRGPRGIEETMEMHRREDEITPDRTHA